jgi:hypothetical protein
MKVLRSFQIFNLERGIAHSLNILLYELEYNMC